MPLKMRNPQNVAKRWVAGLGNATAKIEEGVQSVQESPMARAAEKVQKYEAGILDAISSGRYVRGLSSVTLNDWKQAMLKKGVPRVRQGAAEAEGKFAQFMAKLLPQVDAAVAEIDRMPDATLDDRIARSSAYQRIMASTKGSYR